MIQLTMAETGTTRIDMPARAQNAGILEDLHEMTVPGLVRLDKV